MPVISKFLVDILTTEDVKKLLQKIGNGDESNFTPEMDTVLRDAIRKKGTLFFKKLVENEKKWEFSKHITRREHLIFGNIVGKDDNGMITMAKDGFPRGCVFMLNLLTGDLLLTGFAPKFQNDTLGVSFTDTEMKELTLTLKYSGFLTSVFLYVLDGKVCFSVSSKNSSGDSPYVKRARALWEGILTQNLLDALYASGIRCLSAECMSVEDRKHGYAAKRDALKITCAAYPIDAEHIYMMGNELKDFLKNFPTLLEHLVESVTITLAQMQEIEKRRDVLTLKLLLEIVPDLQTNHGEICGEILEGFVILSDRGISDRGISDRGISDRGIVKYKIPLYTLITMWLREVLASKLDENTLQSRVERWVSDKALWPRFIALCKELLAEGKKSSDVAPWIDASKAVYPKYMKDGFFTLPEGKTEPVEAKVHSDEYILGCLKEFLKGFRGDKGAVFEEIRKVKKNTLSSIFLEDRFPLVHAFICQFDGWESVVFTPGKWRDSKPISGKDEVKADVPATDAKADVPVKAQESKTESKEMKDDSVRLKSPIPSEIHLPNGDSSKTVKLLVGATGLGKTTYANNMGAKRLSEAKPGDKVFVSADCYFKGGVVRPEHLGRAHDECMTDFMTAMASGFETIIVSNTNTLPGARSDIIRLAKLFGYNVDLVFFSRGMDIYRIGISVNEAWNLLSMVTDRDEAVFKNQLTQLFSTPLPDSLLMDDWIADIPFKISANKTGISLKGPFDHLFKSAMERLVAEGVPLSEFIKPLKIGAHVTLVYTQNQDDAFKALLKKLDTATKRGSGFGWKDLTVQGIGEGVEEGNRVFFVVLSCEKLQNILKAHGLQKDLHLTLAYSKNDIHTLKKDVSTVRYQLAL